MITTKAGPLFLAKCFNFSQEPHLVGSKEDTEKGLQSAGIANCGGCEQNVLCDEVQKRGEGVQVGWKGRRSLLCPSSNITTIILSEKKTEKSNKKPKATLVLHDGFESNNAGMLKRVVEAHAPDPIMKDIPCIHTRVQKKGERQ